MDSASGNGAEANASGLQRVKQEPDQLWEENRVADSNHQALAGGHHYAQTDSMHQPQDTTMSRQI
ncbi:hypothetical protein HYFRA_00002430 [Hymenoscyphus fraxineus]|uniref:Uncharacterized protein n=1 Tax=Hymenoscyphus fraxineus TaxID=746836 RepID=A0A9N9PZC3_9HELO|nr:hypothetical protein HYFRA_00002430 [Hymenoscyphus fraxineus]